MSIPGFDIAQAYKELPAHDPERMNGQPAGARSRFLAPPFDCEVLDHREARQTIASVPKLCKRPFGVPAEMAVIEQMKAMRRDGATYRAIGAVTGHGPKSVMRILERVE